VAGNVTEGLVARGRKNIILFATKDSLTSARLVSFIDQGYEEDRTQIGWVSMCLHVCQTLARAGVVGLLTYRRMSSPSVGRIRRAPIMVTSRFPGDFVRQDRVS
jgi:hypothetical protein